MRDHVRELAGGWEFRGSSKLSGFGWILIGSACGWFAVVSVCSAVVAGLQTAAVVFASIAVVAVVVVLVLWRVKRGARVLLDFEADELHNRNGRVALSEFRFVKLRTWSVKSEQAGLERESGWEVALAGNTKTHGVVVVESADELLAWRAAEAVARRLRLPLIDESGGESIVRQPEELDQPILDWLSKIASVPEPGEQPPSVHVDESDERLRIRCTGVGPLAWLGVLGFGAVVGAIVAVIWWGGLLAFPAVSIAVALPTGLFGARGLELDGHTLTLFGPLPRRRRSLPLGAVEAIRLSRWGPRTGLHFVSDRRIVRLQLDARRARWVRHKLLHWLHESAAAKRPRVGAYR